MQYVFDTPEPTVLSVEIGSGNVAVRAADVEQTTIEVTGDRADEVIVEQRRHEIVVLLPKRMHFGFSFSSSLRIEATVPTHTELATRLGSADLVCVGTLGWVKLNTGSGDIALDSVSAEALAKTGSGDIEVTRIDGAANLSSGSGDISVERIAGTAQVSTGSGDVTVGHAGGPIVLKTGSGNLRVAEALGDVKMSAGSGDLSVGRFPSGRFTASNASGDIAVGVPAGVPVWTDISTVTGSLVSTLGGAGQPIAGQPFVELRAKTVSGDVHLRQL